MHTISPTIDSSGLGISGSTLTPMTPSPNRRPLPHPNRTNLNTNRAQPLFQPTFTLRPTHTRQNTFTSFSAIPPSPGSNIPPTHPSPSPSTNPLPLSPGPTPLRSASTSSNVLRKTSKSSEMLRRLSQTRTISGGAYQPLSGVEDHTDTTPNMTLPRSHSTPVLDTQTFPETNYNASPYDHPQAHATARANPMSASHSQNAALFSAESGGMMLAYSPSQGIFKPGQTICGGGTGYIPSPITPEPRLHRRSLSEGYLARQGTLLNPNTSSKRASQELTVLLGKSKRLSGQLLPTADAEKIRLEAARKKARVQVRVVLERECVVEGGEVRGRLEVKVRPGVVRVGSGKVRVVGFEDLSPTSRHIFYHHPHPLPLFSNPPIPNGPTSSLLLSPADTEGYHLASEGTHYIPFNFRLPLGGGAKGSFSSKGPSIRYVVVGSIKIFIPGEKPKRSIAHFYRSIVVLPYLNPSVVLAPAETAIESSVESGLGWSLTGEKGRVNLGVSMGRKIWVSGQRVWCEVGIRNDSTRKIKTLNLALLQTVQLFSPQTDLDPSLSPDQDACQTSTSRRKVAEEVLEADSGNGRVTGNWWTGVDAGERGHWDMSLQLPPGMISIPRSRLIEVSYLLRVTINGSIFVDLPITLINFLSIDPPPMPGDVRPVSRMPITRAVSNQSFNPARASSTTLHIDALLEQGRARAQLEGIPVERERPLSIGSDYTPVDSPTVDPAIPALPTPKPTRPKGARVMSYLSVMSASTDHDEDETDEALLEARRRQGRQRSLAAITRAIDRANEALFEGDEDEDVAEYRPLETPLEEHYKLGQTPSIHAMPRVDEGIESIASHNSPHSVYAPSDNTPHNPSTHAHSVDSHKESLPSIPEHDAGSIPLPTETGSYDYGEEIEDELPPRPRFDSIPASAVSNVSEQESVGEVYQAVKRNLSTRLPPSDSRLSDHLYVPTIERRASHDSPRRGSALSMRRESSNTPSPLRTDTKPPLSSPPRRTSTTSQLRQVEELPPLAPSVASDSASSDGHALDSPDAITAMDSYTMTPYRVEPVSAHSSPSSTHSILPSVQTKIAQLESRNEALRKFSVSASVGPPSPPVPTKRRSYTAALAPRSSSYDDGVGYTTYTVKRTYSNSISPYTSINGRLQRSTSNHSSVSMGATTIEHALMNMSPIGKEYAFRYDDGVAEETDDSEGLV